MRKNPIFLILFLSALIGLFLYSFTQVDLSLTLSRVSVWQGIQKSFQYVGYFNRPLSTGLFLFLVALLFGVYFYGLQLVRRKQFIAKDIVKLSGIAAVILLFSYNAFSYDLFNYVFDAKIVTYYHENPYEHKALDYPQDPMLSFMRWTHRTYPYGPVWLGVTVPLSFLGLQYFVPTFFLFKAMIAACYFGTAFFIGKILRIVKPEFEALGMAFFAFNPLVLIESVVSSHNDIVMLFFAVLALYMMITKKYVVSIVLLLFSVGIKFATILLLPVFAFLAYVHRKKKHVQWDIWFITMVVVMFAAVMLATVRTTYQPWYLLYFLTFASFLSHRYYIFIPSIILSLVSLLNYVPFLYLGNWDPPVPGILMAINISSLFISLILICVYYLFSKRLHE